MADLAKLRSTIAAAGTQLAFVHLNDPMDTGLFDRHGLSDLPRFTDPTGMLYHVFGLRRGRLRQFLSRIVTARHREAKIHGTKLTQADMLQMPGVFLIHQNRIVKAFRHETVADRPDYQALATCPLP